MTIVDKILKEFPDFKESHFYSGNEGLPYVFIPFFADYLTFKIKNNDSDYNRIIEFVDNLYNNGTDEEKNQLWIGIFEVCAGDLEVVNLLTQKFTDKTKSDFYKFINN